MYRLQLKQPRQWGACWLAYCLWDQLKLNDIWQDHAGVSRQGTHWLNALKTLVCFRLIAPGSLEPILLGEHPQLLDRIVISSELIGHFYLERDFEPIWFDRLYAKEITMRYNNSNGMTIFRRRYLMSC